VRGTRWQTIDRCDGTLIRVLKGSVSVRDVVKKKTIVVKAGKSYLAKR
jgi:ferric-dicitrate binding protein FerR (iron transport regulator)